MTDLDILKAIPSTEPAMFNEFLRGLDDAPERGDRAGWAELFRGLDRLERDGRIEVERANGKIDTLILTESGAASVRKG